MYLWHGGGQGVAIPKTCIKGSCLIPLIQGVHIDVCTCTHTFAYIHFFDCRSETS